VEMEAPVPREPGADLGVLVGGAIVHEQMHRAPGRGFAVDLVEEADEFLMPVRLMHWPMILPSSTLSGANRVVVPWRL
jgi:hypothetical protein